MASLSRKPKLVLELQSVEEDAYSRAKYCLPVQVPDVGCLQKEFISESLNNRITSLNTISSASTVFKEEIPE